MCTFPHVPWEPAGWKVGVCFFFSRQQAVDSGLLGMWDTRRAASNHGVVASLSCGSAVRPSSREGTVRGPGVTGGSGAQSRGRGDSSTRLHEKAVRIHTFSYADFVQPGFSKPLSPKYFTSCSTTVYGWTVSSSDKEHFKNLKYSHWIQSIVRHDWPPSEHVQGLYCCWSVAPTEH